jgi:hypothetical protein
LLPFCGFDPLALLIVFFRVSSGFDPWDGSWRWYCLKVKHTTDMSTSAPATVTIEIPADLAWRLKVACGDSASVWHQHWRDVADGKRNDLDGAACASISRNAWALWEILNDQGV